MKKKIIAGHFGINAGIFHDQHVETQTMTQKRHLRQSGRKITLKKKMMKK